MVVSLRAEGRMIQMHANGGPCLRMGAVGLTEALTVEGVPHINMTLY